MKPGLVPTSLCFPGFPPDKTGDPAGSTTWTVIFGSYSFNVSPVPVIVPPVPDVPTNAANFFPVDSIASDDFSCSCCPMNIRICFIFKLHWNKAIRNFFSNFLCLIYATRHSFFTWSQD